MEIGPLSTLTAEQLGVGDARGVLVQAMRRDAAAYGAGLRPGDVIVAFNGTAITDGGQLSRLIQDARIGSTATVAVIRDGRRLELQIDSARQHELSLSPELILAVTLAVVAAYVIAHFISRIAESVLRAVIADSNLEAMFVDRPQRIVRLTIFLVISAALIFPAVRIAGYETVLGSNPQAVVGWLLAAGLRIVVIAIGAWC